MPGEAIENLQHSSLPVYPAATRLEKLFLNHPTLEFRQALDLAAAPLNQPNAPGLAIVSSEFYAVELLRRCWQPLAICSSGGIDLENWLPEAHAWAWNTLITSRLEEAAEASHILWAEPEIRTAGKIAAQLRLIATPGAKLSVVASTPLRRFLPAWQSDYLPARSPLSAASLPGLLRKTGWQVVNCIGFHGLHSVVWTYAMRLAEGVKRADVADRLRFTVRAVYQVTGRSWSLAPLALINAQPLP